MIGWKEVPAEHLIGQCKVALENTGHLSVEVVPPTELLQDLHSEHEDLPEILLLQHTHHQKAHAVKLTLGSGTDFKKQFHKIQINSDNIYLKIFPL